MNGGFDGSAPWRIVAARISDGAAVLLRDSNERSAQVRQPLTGLEADTRYLLSARLRADGEPDGEVIIELVGHDYGSTDRRLRVLPTEIGTRFNTFSRLVQSGTPPARTGVRVLSFSSVPIVVDDVSLLQFD